MDAFGSLRSRVIALPVNNIDTDQIIPARFLKTTDKTGLGAHLFADWRYRADGSPEPDFLLNRPEAAGAQILLAGDNFGCGSSREHAPWALSGFGFRAVISTSFADIFRNNALKNGLLPVQIERVDHQALLAFVSANPAAEFVVDLEQQAVFWPDGRAASFAIDSFSRMCLLQGVDELGYLLGHEAQIGAYERRLESLQAPP